MKTEYVCNRIYLFLSLYPTFKEWKLVYLFMYTIVEYSLYPTFKEWKPMFPSNGL